MGWVSFRTHDGCGVVRRRRGARGSSAFTLRRGRYAWRLTGFEVSVGAGSISLAGGEAALLATGTSSTGAAAVWLSVEVVAMATFVWVVQEDASALQAGLLFSPVGSRPL